MTTAPLPVSDVVVVGVGARAHHGLTALQVTMSVRAGKMDARESHLIDKHGDPMGVCRLMSIGDQIMGIDRFVALGGPALTQAAFPWTSVERRKSQAIRPLPVVVALPSATRPGFDARLREHLIRALEARSQVPVDHARSALVTACRGGGVRAFELALELVRGGEVPAVLVGGIDTYFDPDVLEWLDAELRLHSMQTENGFIPGEGAAFALLMSRGRATGMERLGQIVSAATTLEPRPYGHEEPCLGQGITAAVRAAVAPVGAKARRVGWALTDVANERHRVDEWSYAMARNHEAFGHDLVHDQPLLKTGDVGAASAAMLVAMAATRWQTGCAVADIAVVATHSDGAERGAMVVSMDPGPAAA